MRLQMRKEPFAGWYCPLALNSFIHFMWIVAHILFAAPFFFYFLHSSSFRSLFCCYSDWLDNDFLFSSRIFFVVVVVVVLSSSFLLLLTDFMRLFIVYVQRSLCVLAMRRLPGKERCSVRLLLHPTNSSNSRTAGCGKHVRFGRAAIVFEHFERFLDSEFTIHTKENYLRRNSHLDSAMKRKANEKKIIIIQTQSIHWMEQRTLMEMLS